MDKKSIELLNKAIADELSAIHQYMYFHFHCDDQGLDLFANLFKRTAIDEMTHVEKLAERILFLKGEVDMFTSHSVEKIKDVKDMLEHAAKMEQESARETDPILLLQLSQKRKCTTICKIVRQPQNKNQI